MLPRGARDQKRANQRSGIMLPIGRPVLGQTQHYRDKLLDLFVCWLQVQGVSFNGMVLVPMPNVEGVNLLLERYGRALIDAGRP